MALEMDAWSKVDVIAIKKHERLSWRPVVFADYKDMNVCSKSSSMFPTQSGYNFVGVLSGSMVNDLGSCNVGIFERTRHHSITAHNDKLPA